MRVISATGCPKFPKQHLGMLLTGDGLKSKGRQEATKKVVSSSLRALVHIVEDNPELLTSLRELLQSHHIDSRGYSSGGEFLKAPHDGHYGCLILDLQLPDMTGLELQEEVVRRAIDFPIIFLTGYATVPVAVEATKKGAFDFLQKPPEDQTVVGCVRRALNSHAELREASTERREFLARYQLLPENEQAIAHLVALGRTNREISDEMKLAVKTIEYHRSRIMQKLDVESTNELVRSFIRHDIHRPERPVD